MDISKIVKNISESCEKMGGFGINGIGLETCSPSLLDIRDECFDEHVAVQPIAIAFYGNLRKIAIRELGEAKDNRERWFKSRFITTKRKAKSEGKATIKDIESMVYEDYEQEANDLDKIVADKQEMVDTLEVWYDAWKAKSYAMAETGKMLQDEFRTPSSIGTQPQRYNGGAKLDNDAIKAIIRKERNGQS
jgi:hypothetical protein